jgi:hypothetical protein
MTTPISIGEMHFRKKGDATAFIKAILNRYDPGDRVSERDAVVLTDLLKMHPESAEKIGAGIESFSVRTADYGTQCFWINRVDGTTERFSYKACF